MKKVPLSEFPHHLKTALEKAKQELLSPSSLQQIGDDIAEQLRLRARLGNGLGENYTDPAKLKPLSPKYVEQRKKMKDLSEETTPKKSNLTQTGEMLDDIIARINGFKITITFKEQFSKDKARWNSVKGRPFMHISRVQVQRLTNDMQSKLRSNLKKYL